MSDSLKNTVNKEPKSFDIYSTDYDSLWRAIDRELDRVERRSAWPLIMKVAAGLILLAVTTLVVYTYTDVKTAKDGIALYQVSPELAETEEYYLQLISDRMSQLQSYPEIESEALSEVYVLDSLYADLRKDLADNIDNEEVVSAMIQTYRLKLEVLENMLHQMRQDKKKEENDEEKDVEEFFL